MRILIFYQYFCTPAGSWSTRIYEFARRWIKRGHSVTVVTAPYEKSDIKASRFISKKNIDGIDLIIINSPDSNRKSTVKRAINSIFYSFISTWYSLTFKYDVVVASSGPITVGIPALAARFIRRKKMIFEVRDLWPQGAVELGKIKNKFLVKLAFVFERICYKHSHTIIACSPDMQKSIISRYPYIKTLLIPNACDIELFSSNNIIKSSSYLNDFRYFLYAGSLGLMDDCIQFIKAAMLIERNNIKFIIIGEGSERNYLEEYVAGNKNIEFLGLLPKHELVSWYKKAWAALVTFKNYSVLQTNSPNKLFDALAAGVPVIQNTQGWIKDLLEKEECGLTVPQENPEKFAQAIILLADNPDLRNKMSINGLRLAQTVFNRDILAEKYISAIEAL